VGEQEKTYKVSFEESDFPTLPLRHPTQINMMPVVHTRCDAVKPVGTCFAIGNEGLVLTRRGQYHKERLIADYGGVWCSPAPIYRPRQDMSDISVGVPITSTRVRLALQALRQSYFFDCKNSFGVRLALINRLTGVVARWSCFAATPSARCVVCATIIGSFRNRVAAYSQVYPQGLRGRRASGIHARAARPAAGGSRVGQRRGLLPWPASAAWQGCACCWRV
jgi:hypothetical protein